MVAIPLTGHYPEVLLRFMHVGPMARTVRDIALALGILASGDDQDSYAQGLPGFDWTVRASRSATAASGMDGPRRIRPD